MAWLSAVSWSFYPLVFIFAEGSGDWSPNFEIMIYGILDMLSKSVRPYCLALLYLCSLLSSLKVRDTKVYEPCTLALALPLSISAHQIFCSPIW